MTMIFGFDAAWDCAAKNKHVTKMTKARIKIDWYFMDRAKDAPMKWKRQAISSSKPGYGRSCPLIAGRCPAAKTYDRQYIPW